MSKKPRDAGSVYIWLSGTAVSVCLLMVLGMIGLIIYNGMGFFWPKDVARLTLKDGSIVLGEILERELAKEAADSYPEQYRIQLKTGNRDLLGSDFRWIDEADILSTEYPADAVVLERLEWGNFYGTLKEVRTEEKVLASGGGQRTYSIFSTDLAEEQRLYKKIKDIEKKDIGLVNAAQEKIRLGLRSLELSGNTSGSKAKKLRLELKGLQTEYSKLEAQITELRQGFRKQAVFLAPTGSSIQEQSIPLYHIARYYQPNKMSALAKAGHYAEKLMEFLLDDPRESNTEGGVFPAIFGTVFMVFVMSIVVTPLGVLAAIYLKEYAKQGRLVSLVRIAVNNLAGVPSIVYGVFGVGFFIYFIGGSIDQLFFPEALPSPTFGTGGILWASLTLALLTVPTVIVATEEGLGAIPNSLREGSYALGATKFETTWRVVLPSLMPAILTGAILAVARAAGEVAPLMITGVVKLAPALAVDGGFPFVHLDRKFMHLGFHIYDVGFQSPNVDAARPMVFTTTLLLICVVLLLNFTAIFLRNRISKKLSVSSV